MTYTTPSSDQESPALQGAMASLIEKVNDWTLAHPREFTTAYPALSLYRHEAPTELTSYLQEPSVCLIAQGHKRVLLGVDEYF